MKKIFVIFSILVLILSQVHANQSVIVSAIVGSLNHAPVILSVFPDSNPRILKVNKTQSYTIYFRDDEKDIVNYTITPQNGYVNPISGTISSSNYDSNSGAYINFLYVAPAIANPNEKIIVTIDDGNLHSTLPNSTTYIVKELNLYIY